MSVPSATKYPGLSTIKDPEVRAVAKILFDMVGGLQQQVPQIGTVSQPLSTHLDANAQQLKAVIDDIYHVQSLGNLHRTLSDVLDNTRRLFSR